MSVFDWLLRLFTRAKGIFSLIVCAFFSSILLSMDRDAKQTFHEVVISTFLYPAQAILSRVNRTIFIFQENEALKRENTSLRTENDFLNQELKAYPRIQDLIQFGDSSGLRLKFAQISGEDPGRSASTWVINLGDEDSVSINMPVLTSKGIVGKIAKCYRSHSLVQLLTDPSSKVSVQCNRSRVKGIMESWRVGKLIARFPIGSDIAEGDTLTTSGMGGVFPKGLLVGVLTGEDLESDDIVKGAGIRLFQNLNLVEEVFVLVREASWTMGGEK